MTATAKRLSVGSGWNRRVTKYGLKVQAAFKAMVEERIRALGAARAPADGPYEARKRDWSIETVHGRLWLTVYGDWIAGLWDDWSRAKEAGHYHWKWNHHYDEGAAEAEVEAFARVLDRLLDHCAACGRALGMPAPDRFGDCDADPQGGSCDCPEFCSPDCYERGPAAGGDS